MEKMSERHSGIWTIAHLKPDDAVQIISGDCKFIWAFPLEHKDNVQRLVTCTNFCDGVSNEELQILKEATNRAGDLPPIQAICDQNSKLRAENERLKGEAELHHANWKAALQAVDVVSTQRDAAKAEAEKWKLRCVALQADVTQTP